MEFFNKGQSKSYDLRKDLFSLQLMHSYEKALKVDILKIYSNFKKYIKIINFSF